jgi:hypothetical protein
MRKTIKEKEGFTHTRPSAQLLFLLSLSYPLSFPPSKLRYLALTSSTFFKQINEQGERHPDRPDRRPRGQVAAGRGAAGGEHIYLARLQLPPLVPPVKNRGQQRRFSHVYIFSCTLKIRSFNFFSFVPKRGRGRTEFCSAYSCLFMTLSLSSFFPLSIFHFTTTHTPSICKI